MYEVQLNQRFAGYSVSAARKGEKVQVQVSGVSSTEDGDLHLKYLNGLPQTILSMLESDIHPCDIRSMVVLISKDLMAKVYINEVEVVGQAFVKANRVEKGQPFRKDDISGFERIQLSGIEFTEDQAYFCVLPVGWDKAYIFDFSPLDDRLDRKIEYDVEKLLGSYFSYLTFSEIHKLSASDWGCVLRQGWFPFYALKYSTVELLLNYAREKWDIDELLDTVESDALLYIEERISVWSGDESLLPLIGFLEVALSRHKENCFVSSTSIIYPKVEALIRNDFVRDHPGKEGRRQNALVEHITEKTLSHISALTTFIPDKFKRYLAECYFKDFDSARNDNPVSRHSVAHGASAIEKFDRKASLIGLLVFSQIAEYIQQSSQKLDKSIEE